MSIADYLHPIERIEAGAQNIIDIFHSVGFPFFAKIENPDSLKQLLLDASLEELFDLLYNEHTDGWKLLYLYKHLCPEKMPTIKNELLDFAEKGFSYDKSRAKFVEQLDLVV